ncbi:MAG: hypothetical protein Q9159_000923 [Coniocarpon cinnabarinum]
MAGLGMTNTPGDRSEGWDYGGTITTITGGKAAEVDDRIVEESYTSIEQDFTKLGSKIKSGLHHNRNAKAGEPSTDEQGSKQQKSSLNLRGIFHRQQAQEQGMSASPAEGSTTSAPQLKKSKSLGGALRNIFHTEPQTVPQVGPPAQGRANEAPAEPPADPRKDQSKEQKPVNPLSVPSKRRMSRKSNRRFSTMLNKTGLEYKGWYIVFDPTQAIHGKKMDEKVASRTVDVLEPNGSLEALTQRVKDLVKDDHTLTGAEPDAINLM